MSLTLRNTTGRPLRYNEVDDNFLYVENLSTILQDSVQINADKITALETTVTTLDSDITTLESVVNSNFTYLSDKNIVNADNISLQDVRITTNTTNIGTNTTDIINLSGTVQTQHNELVTRNDLQDTKIVNLTADVGDLRDEVNAIDVPVDMEPRITQNETSINTIISEANLLEVDVNLNTDNITTNRTDLDQLRSDFDSSGSVTALESRVQDSETHIITLQTQSSTLRVDTDLNETNISSMSGAVTNAVNTANIAKDKTDANEIDIASLQTTVENNTSSISSTNSIVSSLQSDVTTNISNINTTNGNLSALETNHNNLQNTVDNMPNIDNIDDLIDSSSLYTSVLLATTSNTVLSGLIQIDGVIVGNEAEVLVKDQTDTTQNGIYEAASGAWVKMSNSTIFAGKTYNILRGNTNAQTLWSLNTPLSDTIGDSDAITFIQLGLSVNSITTNIFGIGALVSNSISGPMTISPGEAVAGSILNQSLSGNWRMLIPATTTIDSGTIAPGMFMRVS